MINSLTPSRIANSIQQDSSFKGFHILVEGKTDIKLYRKLTCQKESKITVSFGKNKMRQVYNILVNRNFRRIIGIRDADYIRINDNEKFDPLYELNIFLTDNHDSEGMILNSSAFEDFLLEVANEANVNKFIDQFGCIRSYIYKLSYPIACLRFANKKYNLGLAFKPSKPEGKPLTIKKFICDRTISYLGHNKLINAVVEYSTNRGGDIAERDLIHEKLLQIIQCDYPLKELSNGHDLAEIIYILCKKGLKSTNRNLKDAKSVEGMLRLAYGREYFTLTELCKSLDKWQKKQTYPIFNPIVGAA